jgi:hypothetical protein
MTLRLKGFRVLTKAAPVPRSGFRQRTARPEKGNESAKAPART